MQIFFSDEAGKKREARRHIDGVDGAEDDGEKEEPIIIGDARPKEHGETKRLHHVEKLRAG